MLIKPWGIASNGEGKVYITDFTQASVVIFDTLNGSVSGPGDFNIIKGVAIDSEDHIYVTDTMAGNFKIFLMEGELLLVVGATYPRPVPGGFNLPMDIDRNDRIYIVDQMNFAFQV